jgi:L-fucose mutarotase/ribose pyranase (RbsD/FucU family)
VRLHRWRSLRRLDGTAMIPTKSQIMRMYTSILNERNISESNLTEAERKKFYERAEKAVFWILNGRYSNAN